MANSASMAPERNTAAFEAFNKEEAVPDASDCSGYPPARALNKRRKNSVLFQRTDITSMEGGKTPRPRANSTTSCTRSNFKFTGSTEVWNFFSSRDYDLRRCRCGENGLDPLIELPRLSVSVPLVLQQPLHTLSSYR